MCQSVMQPATAEYWHIGAITIRLARSSWPTRIGLKQRRHAGFSLLFAEAASFGAASVVVRQEESEILDVRVFRSMAADFGLPSFAPILHRATSASIEARR